MYPWQAPASFFPHLEALNASTSHPNPMNSLSTSTSMASTSTSVASTSASAVASESFGASVSASGPVVQAKEKKKEKETRAERRKLPEQASNVLKDYCTNITITPTPAQRRELLKLIQTIPGAEWYSTEHISRWFLSRRQAAKNQNQERKREGEGDGGDGGLVGSEGVRKRRRKRREGGEGAGGGVMTSANILWPTLTPEKITKLTVLLREHPHSHPNEAVLEVWARALRAEKDDVWNWVQMNSLSAGSGLSSGAVSSSVVAIKSLPSPSSTSPSSSFPSPTVTVKQEPQPPSQSSSNLKMSMYSPTESHAPLLLGSPVEQKPMLPMAATNPNSALTSASPTSMDVTPVAERRAMETTTTKPTTTKPTNTKQPRIRHPNPYETTRFKVSMLPPLSLSIPGSGPPMLLPPSQLVRDLVQLVQLPTPVEPAPPSQPAPPSRPVPLAITRDNERGPSPISANTNAQTSHSQEELIPLPRPATRSPVIAQHPTPPMVASPRSDRDVEVEGLIPLPRPATRSPVIAQTFQGVQIPQSPQVAPFSTAAMTMIESPQPQPDVDMNVEVPASSTSHSPNRPVSAQTLVKSPETPSPSLPEVTPDSQPHPHSQPQSPAVGSGTVTVTTPPNPDEQGDRHQAMDVEVAAEVEVESSGTSATSPLGLGMSVDVPTVASSEIKKTDSETIMNGVDSTPSESDVPMNLETPSEPPQPATATIPPPPPSPSPALAHPTRPHPSPSPSNPSSPSMTDANTPPLAHSHSETTTSIVNPTLSINPDASASDVPMDLEAPSDHAQSESEPTLSTSPSSSSEDMDLSSPSPSPSTPTSELHYPDDHEPSCTRARNRLAELAVFVNERLSSHSHSDGDCGTLGKPRVSVMEEFSESLRTSEVFFEKIRSGVYSELGLVLRGGNFGG